MDVVRQQGGFHQRSLFEEPTENPRPDAGGDGGTGTAALEEPQTPAAFDQARALTECLMERVVERDNLNRAYRRVKANKGAPGVMALGFPAANAGLPQPAARAGGGWQTRQPPTTA